MKNILKKLLTGFVVLFACYFVVSVPYLLSSSGIRMENEFIYHQLDSLQNVINEMRGVDTLIINMSEHNAKNVEMLEENNKEIRERLKRAENDISRIDADLNAYD